VLFFCDSHRVRFVIRSGSKSRDDADERERAALKTLARLALEENERLKAEGKALREENARLKRLRDGPKRNSSGAS